MKGYEKERIRLVGIRNSFEMVARLHFSLAYGKDLEEEDEEKGLAYSMFGFKIEEVLISHVKKQISASCTEQNRFALLML